VISWFGQLSVKGLNSVHVNEVAEKKVSDELWKMSGRDSHCVQESEIYVSGARVMNSIQHLEKP
jgi:hypothetical protein